MRCQRTSQHMTLGNRFTDAIAEFVRCQENSHGSLWRIGSLLLARCREPEHLAQRLDFFARQQSRHFAGHVRRHAPASEDFKHRLEVAVGEPELALQPPAFVGFQILELADHQEVAFVRKLQVQLPDFDGEAAVHGDLDAARSVLQVGRYEAGRPFDDARGGFADRINNALIEQVRLLPFGRKMFAPGVGEEGDLHLGGDVRQERDFRQVAVGRNLFRGNVLRALHQLEGLGARQPERDVRQRRLRQDVAANLEHYSILPGTGAEHKPKKAGVDAAARRPTRGSGTPSGSVRARQPAGLRRGARRTT